MHSCALLASSSSWSKVCWGTSRDGLAAGWPPRADSSMLKSRGRCGELGRCGRKGGWLHGPFGVPRNRTAPCRHPVSTSLSLAGGISWLGHWKPKKGNLPGGEKKKKDQVGTLKEKEKKGKEKIMAKWPRVETPLDWAWTLAPVQFTFPRNAPGQVVGWH